MRVGQIEPGQELGAQRGAVVICIPLYGAHEHFVRCLDSVLAHTSADVPILICDDASPDARSQRHVEELGPSPGDRQIFYLRRAENVGFPANVNGAFAAGAPADVVILNSDCRVAAGWLEGLREAALHDSRVATVSALTNHGTLVSVPERGIPRSQLPAGWELDRAAAAVRAGSLRLRPRLPTGIGHCLYVRRTALELVGDFDEAFTPGYGEEVDFSQRCRRSGLTHVVADDVLVEHHGAGSFAGSGVPSPVQAEHERTLAIRYPYYHQAVRAVERDAAGPLARSLGAARRSLTGLEVVIDARILVGPMTGTLLHVLEVLAAVCRTDAARVSAILPANLSPFAKPMLDCIPGLRQLVIPVGAPVSTLGRADIFHRPFQVSSPADLAVAARLGERLVLTQQDMIAYHNPAYFSTFDRWENYRALTRKALALADRVIFISAHARDDALSEDLIEPSRASVVPNGVDHTLGLGGQLARTPPRQAEQLEAAEELILCIGTDFHHKNRCFALRLAAELQQEHEWRGVLVFAGPHVSEGSSAAEEKAFLSEHPQLLAAVVDLGPVSEAEKLWLLGRSSLVLYPTVHEGFGLIPFEAADHHVPCLWAPGTSLSELLPDSAAGIVPWDPVASARAALELMRSEPARTVNLAAIRTAAAGLTWDASARRLVEIYELTCNRASTPVAAIEHRAGEMGPEISDDAMRLVGPNGALPTELQRPLLALATHPSLSAPLFAAVRLGYRLGYRLRRVRA